MFNKIQKFWNAFFASMKQAYKSVFKGSGDSGVQRIDDTARINFLSVFVSKLNNYANMESTYTVESDSIRAEPIIDLCKELETSRFDITAAMLGEGECWVFPAHTSTGNLFHRYVRKDKVKILDMDGDIITDVIGIIDEFVDKNGKTFFLNRRHTLEGDTLTVDTYITNERNERTPFEDWDSFVGTWALHNAKHIGVGRFKSPASSRGKETVYGVPLNYGCEEIEKKIFADLAMIEKEFKNAESKIFADPLILKKNDNKQQYDIPENVFPINHREGSTASIDIFSPGIRYGEYQAKLLNDLQIYEQQVGTDRGILTPFDDGKAVTATEIRRANASTISLIDRIHTAIKSGVEMTLRADSVFLNIPPELYTVLFDFFDPFEDTDKQYERISNAVDRGIAEKSDELKWLFPNLTPEECAAKLERIAQARIDDTDRTVESLYATE